MGRLQKAEQNVCKRPNGTAAKGRTEPLQKAERNRCKRPNGTAAKGRTERLQKAEQRLEVSEKMS
jgi:hypothetical protein